MGTPEKQPSETRLRTRPGKTTAPHESVGVVLAHGVRSTPSTGGEDGRPTETGPPSIGQSNLSVQLH
jgi:hypothetical protein